MSRTTTMTVRLSGAISDFVTANVGENGSYENVSEYIRDLIRADRSRAMVPRNIEEEYKMAGAPNCNVSEGLQATGYTRSDGVTTVVFQGGTAAQQLLFQLRYSGNAWQPYDPAVDLLTHNGL